jgi:outer membrane protein TolC
MKKLTYALVLLITFVHTAFAQRTLTLAESMELALRNNAEMKNSRLQAEAAVSLRRSALPKYFPQISAGGLVFHSQKYLYEMKTPAGNLPVYDGNPMNLFRPTQFAYFPGGTTSMLKEVQVGYVDVMQPLFTGGRIIYGNQMAAVGRDVARYHIRLTEDEITLSTEEQYWRILSLNEKRITLAKFDTLLSRLLQQAIDANKSGLILRNDVLKIRLKQNDLKLDISRLDNGRKLAAMAFYQFIGLADDSTIIIKEEWPDMESPSRLYVDPRTVLPSRTEYRLLEKAVQAARLQTRLKRGEYLPHVGVGLRSMIVKLDEADRRTHNVFFGSISVPISDWIAGASEIKEHHLKEEIARNDLKDRSELLLLQMQKAWQDFGDSYKQLLLAEEAKAQAEENLKINEDSYRNGLTSVSDLLEAQAMLQQTCDQLTDSRADYMIKKTQYLQATGRDEPLPGTAIKAAQ